MYKVCIVNSLPIAMGVSNKDALKALTLKKLHIKSKYQPFKQQYRNFFNFIKI